ncbi:MAG: phosphatase PAP2 family protein [Eudoraea sp.]|nr:phosphatase PAP2 family protein [Eudoraea sp.]
MIEDLIQLDKEIFLFLNNLGSESWDGFWMFITNQKSGYPLYALLLFFSYKNLGTRNTMLLLVAVALLITCTDQLSNFFKYGVQRLRPCYDPELDGLFRLVKNSCGGKYGYFSGHAVNSFAVAFFFTFLLGARYKLLAVFLMIWASFVAYSRVYIGVHFPLDVLTGAGVGILFSWLFARLYLFSIHKYLA